MSGDDTGIDEAIAALDGGTGDAAPQASSGADVAPAAPTDGFDSVVRRLVDIDDELERSGANKLLKEREQLRGDLKEAMGKAKRERVVDEVSGYYGALVPSFSDEWDTPKTKAVLKGTGLKETFWPLKLVVDPKGMKALIDRGTVTRATLEKRGAVSKRLRSVSLQVRSLKDD